MFFYSITASSWIKVFQGFANFFLIGGAAFVAGGLIGFLFGIPRTIAKEPHLASGYNHNTNLEQVSDWLTKVLLGVSLTQASDIIQFIKRIAIRASDQMTMFGDESVFVSSLILYFLVCGFLDGYLATRLLLVKALVEVDETLAFHDPVKMPEKASA
jgi:hypothetical protein